jgi:hypothetical protein
MGGMVMRRFPWLSRFQSDVLPVGYKRGEPLLDYYGRPLRADEAALWSGLVKHG